MHTARMKYATCIFDNTVSSSYCFRFEVFTAGVKQSSACNLLHAAVLYHEDGGNTFLLNLL
jgi:hypothetical protein